MPITIEPLIHDNLDDFIRLWWDAFSPEDANQVLPMIYPEGLTLPLLNRLKHRILAETDGDTSEFCFIARDDASKRIAGISWWKPLNKPAALSSEADAEKDLQASIARKNSGPEDINMNTALGDAFFTALFSAERRTIQAKQVPYIILNVLGVHPDFGRQGVGSQLVEHGLKRVDSLNVWTWLCASGHGRGLYLKHDFELVEELDFDGANYGGRSTGHHCIMIRPPQNNSISV